MCIRLQYMRVMGRVMLLSSWSSVALAGHNNSNLPQKKTQVFGWEWGQFRNGLSPFCFYALLKSTPKTRFR